MSNLKIFIPTYKRPKTLYWSLESVLKQDFNNKQFNRQIFIINNDESSYKDVNDIVDLVIENNKDHQFNTIEILQGNKNSNDKNLLLTYEIIFAKSDLNDISIVHCDDDIMLPMTLLNRYLKANLSKYSVFVEKFISPAYIFQNESEIYFDNFNYEINNQVYNKAESIDLIKYSIPFLSIYTYKINDSFKEIYNNAVIWANEINLEQKIKYPFIPFFIGLSAYYHHNLGTANNNIVIRGTLFNKNLLNYPRVETEYANTGIILLTGLYVLKNKSLRNLEDYNLLRNDFTRSVNEFLLVTLFNRDGVSYNEIKRILKFINYDFTFKTYISSISLKSIRNLLNNLLFDTRYLKRYIFGWGNKHTRKEFWIQIHSSKNSIK